MDIIKESLWEQFGASIDTLGNAIAMWPDELWEKKPKAFRMAFHTLFFLEYYLTFPADNFKPALEISPDGEGDFGPSRIYSKKEMLEYVAICKSKCKEEIDKFNERNLATRWAQQMGGRYFEINYFELMMYNMRHVQHHSAQLNMMLRNEINDAPDWVSRTSDPTL